MSCAPKLISFIPKPSRRLRTPSFLPPEMIQTKNPESTAVFNANPSRVLILRSISPSEVTKTEESVRTPSTSKINALISFKYSLYSRIKLFKTSSLPTSFGITPLVPSVGFVSCPSFPFEETVTDP